MGAGAALGFFFGILEDAFSVLAFGASALAMTVVGILGARTRDLFVGDSLLFLFVYLALGKLLRDLIYWVVAGEPDPGALPGRGSHRWRAGGALSWPWWGPFWSFLFGGTRGLR